MNTLLEISGLSVSYGPIPALRDVSLRIERGDVYAIIGANGAGKSTLTLAIGGAVASKSGSIVFDGTTINGLPPEQVAQQGISLVPEGRHIFEGLSVLENLQLGMTVANPDSEKNALQDIFERFPILSERRHSMGTHLSGGEQQQLAIGRALLSQPKLLILDEPSLGLSPLLVDRVYETLATLKQAGMTILLVEQNPGRVGDVANKIMIISGGEVQMTGSVEELKNTTRLQQAYLGERR